MVYRRKRAVAAGVLREFRDGEISNREYERLWPRNTGDRVFGEIFWQIWFFYDDLSTHRMTGKYELQPEIRELFDRCILFLESDLEYDWPKGKFGNARFLLDCPAFSFRSWLGLWPFLGLTGSLLILIILISKLYEKAILLVPVIIYLWIVYGVVRLVYGMILWLIKGLRPGREPRPEIKFQTGKEYWPFHEVEDLKNERKRTEVKNIDFKNGG